MKRIPWLLTLALVISQAGYSTPTQTPNTQNPSYLANQEAAQLAVNEATEQVKEKEQLVADKQKDLDDANKLPESYHQKKQKVADAQKALDEAKAELLKAQYQLAVNEQNLANAKNLTAKSTDGSGHSGGSGGQKSSTPPPMAGSPSSPSSGGDKKSSDSGTNSGTNTSPVASTNTGSGTSGTATAPSDPSVQSALDQAMQQQAALGTGQDGILASTDIPATGTAGSTATGTSATDPANAQAVALAHGSSVSTSNQTSVATTSGSNGATTGNPTNMNELINQQTGQTGGMIGQSASSGADRTSENSNYARAQ